MSAGINRQWILAARPTGMVGPEHFALREAAVPQPGPGEVLVRTRMLSLDPANRAWMFPSPTYKAPVEPGDVMHGFALGEVVASNDPGFRPGDLVDGMIGWQDYAALPGDELARRDAARPAEQLLGILGVTGLTAYFGLREIGRPKAGETVLVSAAAGAVGSVVGQIAKIMGCRVVGTAGGPEKCRWLTDELGFDAAIDYKAGGVRRALKEAAPGGVDVYFDNVGAETLDAILPLMRLHGRVAVCGMIAQYNDADNPHGNRNLWQLVVNRLTMRGFITYDHPEVLGEAQAMLDRLFAEGKLKPLENVREGLEKLPEAFIDLMSGKTTGKTLVLI